MLIQELIDPSRIPVTCEVFFQNFLNLQNISESILKPPETLKPSETFLQFHYLIQLPQTLILREVFIIVRTAILALLLQHSLVRL